MPAPAHDESEYRTRRQRIDPMLEAQGWHVVPFGPARPLGQSAPHAITEFPTENRPADYALSAASQRLGIVEATNRVFGGEHEQMVEALNQAMAAQGRRHARRGSAKRKRAVRPLSQREVVPMTHQVKKLEVWVGEIEDSVGGLAAKLEPLANAGADLQLLIARRQPHLPGKGVVFLGGVAGAKATRAATAAGLAKATDVSALRVEGPNQPGAAYQITRRLADAGVNLRGASAGVLGSKFLLFLAFDSAADADKAARSLRAGGGTKK